MQQKHRPGLGELLRHLSDLVDGGAQKAYSELGLNYRPRYTPVMRAVQRGLVTVKDITLAIKITQSAVSQTVKLMEQDGLVERCVTADGRSQTLLLTRSGAKLLGILEEHWAHTFIAIESIEAEINRPLRATLEAAISALEVKDFAARLSEARAEIEK